MQLASKDKDRLRVLIEDASKTVAQSWPLKTFAYRNPLRGLEHLPFDEAIRQGKESFGGSGYLPNDDYRQLHRDGEITDTALDSALDSALKSIAESVDSDSVAIGQRCVSFWDVLRLHLLFGLDSLDPSLLDWTLQAGGALERFRHDVPAELRVHERDRAPVVGELWKQVLAAVRKPHDLGRNASETTFDSGERDCRDSTADLTHADMISLPNGRTLGDWVNALTGVSIVDQINDQMIKWCAAFLDEGMASWKMPDRTAGFYDAWRFLAAGDWSGRFVGIKRLGRKIRELPPTPEEAVESSLQRLCIPESQWIDYLSRHLAQLPGWTGFIRWRGENPGYPFQHTNPIDPGQYLAVRLFYEVELVEAACRREWGIDGTLPALLGYWEKHRDEYTQRMSGETQITDADTQAACRDGWRLFHLAQFLGLTSQDVQSLSTRDVQTLLGWLDAFPSEDHGVVWLTALEISFRDRLIAKLSASETREAVTETSTLAQFVFCIDVRSEPMRRCIETQKKYETFGFAGFFGIPMSHQAFDDNEHAALCPVILSPKFAVNEVARDGEQDALDVYATSSRWSRLGESLFYDLKRNAISSVVLIDVAGVFFSAMLGGKTFFQRKFDAVLSRVSDWFGQRIATQIPVERCSVNEPDESDETDSLQHGFTVAEQATFVENAMRAIGLTKDFGRFVVICGHGSTSDNNPYFAAYNCGACGGGHGDANARVFTRMANSPEVRDIVRENGVYIPQETWFLAAKHNTVTDSITFYDTQDVPASHDDDFQQLVADMQRASELQAQSRGQTLPQTPANLSPQAAHEHMMARSVDWANVRPEWGLSGNAAFVLGRRALTDRADLEGRVFLQSYDWATDPQGAILEALMTAPLVVAQWISMEYYFSAVDPNHYGSGSKVTHNVVSGVGVMHGAHGDLQAGLPLQSVNDGRVHYHKPVRLLAIIEAPTNRIETAIGHHVLLQDLLHNQWIHLVAVDPETGTFQRYVPDATWEPLT
ncbi:DUF2309 domain-containing protein [Stieleria varia]|uniref:Probable inorganic carbon transporter subunit DabA n=1 Tax=Stieleria varia TaxID=2528005 RepID=A0A5C6B3P7_9BACT|nr:DUF2309 domain-containing protein [Stieleria varia]TWU06162.1 hypothetical protein Pla52n_18820 [Stieleria varia]